MAAVLWSSVGVFLLVRGAINLLALDEKTAPVFIILWMAAGICKGWFVLDRVAEKIRKRAWERADKKCMFGFLPIRSWLLVLSMILFGRILRLSPLSPFLVWGIYSAIGTALLFSSRRLWQNIFKEAV